VICKPSRCPATESAPVSCTGGPCPLGVCAVRQDVAWGIDWFARVASGKNRGTKEGVMPRVQIKDEKTYGKLRDTCASKEKAELIKALREH
jgi:hypothetical protein